MGRERLQPLAGEKMLHTNPPHPLPIGPERSQRDVIAAVGEMHGGESPRPGGENVVLLKEDLADSGGVVGGDGVDAAELQVDEWAVLSRQRRHVAVGEVGELEEVADDGPARGAGREISGVGE